MSTNENAFWTEAFGHAIIERQEVFSGGVWLGGSVCCSSCKKSMPLLSQYDKYPICFSCGEEMKDTPKDTMRKVHRDIRQLRSSDDNRFAKIPRCQKNH